MKIDFTGGVRVALEIAKKLENGTLWVIPKGTIVANDFRQRQAVRIFPAKPRWSHYAFFSSIEIGNIFPNDEGGESRIVEFFREWNYLVGTPPECILKVTVWRLDGRYPWKLSRLAYVLNTNKFSVKDFSWKTIDTATNW